MADQFSKNMEVTPEQVADMYHYLNKDGELTPSEIDDRIEELKSMIGFISQKVMGGLLPALKQYVKDKNNIIGIRTEMMKGVNPPVPKDMEPILTISDICDIYKVNRTSVGRWLKAAGLNSISKVNPQTFYRKDIELMLIEQKVITLHSPEMAKIEELYLKEYKIPE